MKNKKAFTLAEVLITLGIIGIVAALTIPTLISKYENNVSATKLIKTYSMLQSAFTNISNDNGTPGSFNNIPFLAAGSGENSDYVVDAFRPYLRIASEKPSGCWEYGFEQGAKSHCIHGQTGNDDGACNSQSPCRPQVILDSGVALGIYSNVNKCDDVTDTCGRIYVDTNATKPPNTWGRDIFVFEIYSNGIFPHGTSGKIQWAYADTPHGDACTDPSAYGHNCALKIITEGGMNY